MKSASVSLAGTSFFSRSRRKTAPSSRGHSRADRSSGASIAHPRLSTDSTWVERPIVMDQAVMERSLQRRRILEELIETEESYIGDVRFLMNVYITILASLPTLSPGLRSSINQNLTDIIQLHEDLLGDLHRVVPHSEYSQLDAPPTSAKLERGSQGHRRWKSLDAVLEDKTSLSLLQEIPGMTTEAQVAAEVAKVFSKQMNRFFIYEEYGAKYELMIKDVASAHRTMPKWESYQKGLETLAAALGTTNNHGDLKKSLTIGDLLVKPIQRVCRYPLLFAELLKFTPVCDCPHSHMEIEATLIRLREATAEINRATDDSRIKATLEKTWILQDRLVFPNQLCGALHICWQTKDSVDGQYMAALLYRDWLCLAIASRVDQIYLVQACINITTAKIEDIDNGRGIQCHTAPYSWKLVFLCDHQLYEIIMTACTVREEQEWRSRLSQASGRDTQTLNQPMFDSLALNIKALGTVFGKQGTIARRISVHRATTVGPKTPLCQVILRNTSVVRDAAPSSSSSSSSSTTTSISRSMSLLTTNNRIPVLAPPHGERAKLEALLSDVWTRDVLPFPGITARSRSEYLVKASASSMMRKLSVASITGSFGRRSHSQRSSGFRRTDSGEEPATATAAAAGGGGPPGSGRRQARSEPTPRGTDSAQASVLSSIPDEAGWPQVESEWGIDVLRTVGQIVGDAKRLRDEMEGEVGTRPATPGNKRVKRTFSTLRRTRSEVRVSENKNVYVSPKKSARWNKVGVLRGDAVVRGIRSLFQ
ncbi:Dbl homology domain-containing protein [Coniochaeta sp. PMI_546]|nr:Dbl homology domain-containing protein [Coniochaeta sp. PMI_546]